MVASGCAVASRRPLSLVKIWKATYVRRDKRLFVRDATVVRRQLTSEVLHGAGLNYFMRARGWLARGRGEGTPVAVHYGVYVPRLPARPRDCIIDIRPTPVPPHECTPVYEREKKKKKENAERACALERDHSWIFAAEIFAVPFPAVCQNLADRRNNLYFI